MKLKNLFFATMVACAFSSCSKDEVLNAPAPGTGEGDATLEIKIESPALTKSILGDSNKDMEIESLGLYVFNKTADDTYKLEVLPGTASGLAVGESVKATGLTAGAKKVVVLANYAPAESVVSVGTNLIDFLTLEKMITDEANGALSMNSKVYDLNLEAGKTNFLGYADNELTLQTDYKNLGETTVKLYRNVAKVVLNKFEFAPKAQYESAQFFMDSVFILHGAERTLIATTDEWGATEVKGDFLNGVNDASYVAWATEMATLTKKQVWLSSGYPDEVFAQYAGKSYTDTEYTAPVAKADSFYVYENLNVGANEAKTLLVVAGRMNYGADDDSRVIGERRYYSVAVGIDNVSGNVPTFANSQRATSGVLRNLQYNIDLKVTGPGWETPFGGDQKDKTALDVKVEVVPFGQVGQSVEIE